MSLFVSLENVSKVYTVGNSVASHLVSAMASPTDNEEVLQGKVAVNQVSFTLREGERLGIVGRNGAGKSTLLHMIAGISGPTAGQILINGKVTSIMTLGVGLRDDLSGRQNIYIDGEIHGKSRAEVDLLIEEVIDFSELGKFIDYPVRTYSTGMKARLAFSMITHIDPEILIIDEALSVGDAVFAAKATVKILEICERGKIVILVSHGMQSVRDICNRCIYLKDGAIVMDGTPEVVTKAYIDEVRGEDEAELMKRFSAHIKNQSFVDGYELNAPVMLSGTTERHSTRIEAGKVLKIQIHGLSRMENSLAICRVRIVRLDELLMFEEEFSVSEYCTNSGALSLEIEFSSFHLGNAIYRLDLELLDRLNDCESIYSVASSIFEVYSLSPPSGGKPMLYYPIRSFIKND
jgi:lipopolysaccharide transport system ATP-binding protein